MRENSSRFLLQEVTLITNHSETNVKELMQGIDIFENIYAQFMSGKIIIQDAIGLWHKAPIIGEEKIRIRFQTSKDHDAFDMTFDIYKMDDVSTPTEKIKNYTLHFVSEVVMKNLRKKISRSYSGLTSDIVEKIAKTYLDADFQDVEKAKYSYEFVVPNWTPLKTINYLAQRSIASDTDAASYLFFETRDGFIFSTIDKLNLNNAVKFLSYSNLIDSRVLDNNIVAEYHFDKTFDTVANSKNGMYGGTMYTHDILNKQIQTFVYNYENEFDKDTHINRSESDGFTEEREITGKEKIFIEPHNYINRDIEQWKLRRASRVSQTDNYVVVATIGSDTNLNVGDVSIFLVPAHDGGVSTRQEIDPYLSGSFLISRIRHSLNSEQHIMTLELRKDCLNKV